MNKTQQGVKDFMDLAGQTVRTKPTVAPFDERVLRVKLTLEETFELAKASGVKVSLNGEPIDENKIQYVLDGDVDMILVADSIADINYINYGSALCFGIDMEPIEEIVQNANMAKFGEGSYKRPDGKWMKPANWEAPDKLINEELHRQS